jgi:hypothetical protein
MNAVLRKNIKQIVSQIEKDIEQEVSTSVSEGTLKYLEDTVMKLPQSAIEHLAKCEGTSRTLQALNYELDQEFKESGDVKYLMRQFRKVRTKHENGVYYHDIMPVKEALDHPYGGTFFRGWLRAQLSQADSKAHRISLILEEAGEI